MKRLSFTGNYTPILIGLLLITSFLLGMLVTKVQYLEKSATQAVQGATKNPIPPAEQQTPPTKADVSVGNLPILGQKDAKVTIVEFSDFQCPFCERLWKETIPQLKKEHIDTGKARFAYRHFPLTAIHPNAAKAAEASECANDQKKFWQYHDQLFENQTSWANQSATDAASTFASLAEKLGLNTSQFTSCLESGKYKANVD